MFLVWFRLGACPVLACIVGLSLFGVCIVLFGCFFRCFGSWLCPGLSCWVSLVVFLLVFLVPVVTAGVGGECFSSLVCALGCWSCCCGSFELVLGVETLFVKYFYLVKVVNKGGHCAQFRIS